MYTIEVTFETGGIFTSEERVEDVNLVWESK